MSGYAAALGEENRRCSDGSRGRLTESGHVDVPIAGRTLVPIARGGRAVQAPTQPGCSWRADIGRTLSGYGGTSIGEAPSGGTPAGALSARALLRARCPRRGGRDGRGTNASALS